MTIDEIKELIHVVHDTGIAELEVQRGENRVRIRSAATGHQDYVVSAAAAPTLIPSVVMQAPAVATNATPQAAPSEPTVAKEDENNIVVKSPIVGTYYDAPAPGTAPFVRTGDRVEPKQVLCIIESMKLMNEIEAEVSGTIVAKLVENGRPVEYGESLFTIRPA